MSAHVLVEPPYDCHAVAEGLRSRLAEHYGIDHVTLQVDHAVDAVHHADNCADAHGVVHVAPGIDEPN
jgi:cobalt-zinc-cadmium efflux system protein